MKNNSKIICLVLLSLSTIYAKYYWIKNDSDTYTLAKIFNKAGKDTTDPWSTNNLIGTFGKAFDKNAKDAIAPGTMAFFETDQEIGKIFVFPENEALKVDPLNSSKSFNIVSNSNPDPANAIINALEINPNGNYTITNKTNKTKAVWLYGKNDEYIGSFPQLKPNETKGYFVPQGQTLDRFVLISLPAIATTINENSQFVKGFTINKNFIVAPASDKTIASFKAQNFPSDALTIMTLNCYAFNQDKRNIKKIFIGGDLHEGVNMHPRDRLDLIGSFTNSISPDVAIFQEVWEDTNKETLIYSLNAGSNSRAGYYPNTFWEKFSSIRPDVSDSGLLIASKFPFVYTNKLEYTDKEGDDARAKKGALLVAIKKNGQPIIIVDTHLQSGGEWNDVVIRFNQMKQLGKFINDCKAEIIKTSPEFKNASIIIGGDLNEPISLEQTGRAIDKLTLLNRPALFVNALKESNVDLSNFDSVKKLVEKYGAQQVLDIMEETQQGGRTSEGIFKDTTGNVIKKISVDRFKIPIDPNGPLASIGELSEQYLLFFEDASVPRGFQLLDHFLTDRNTQLNYLKVFRKELLGDTSNFKGPGPQPTNHFNPNTALSDHAAVLAAFTKTNEIK